MVGWTTRKGMGTVTVLFFPFTRKDVRLRVNDIRGDWLVGLRVNKGEVAVIAWFVYA